MSRGTTEVVVASTAFGLATAVAAIEDGLLPPVERRILVVANTAAVPELTADLRQVAGVTALLGSFDAVHTYADVVDPQHPSLWRPPADDLPLWQRQLARAWGLPASPADGELRLLLESVHVPPAQTLARIFADARIDVYADGLMSFGPTHTPLPATVAARVERLLHLDLVPGLTPVLLTEIGVAAHRIGTDAFRSVVDRVARATSRSAHPAPGAAAVLLGQYLAAGGILTPAEEQAVGEELVAAAVADGHRDLVFKPHPGAPPEAAVALVAYAREGGARLRMAGGDTLAETWYARGEVGAVYGCFSTGLLTAATVYGLPARRAGTEHVLRRLRPYANSNRIPAVIVDDRLPGPHGTTPSPAGIQTLVEAVAYCMQPELYPGLRASAEALLPAERARSPHYWQRRRLTELGLPGGQPPPRHPVKHAIRTVLGPGAYRDLGRAWAGLRG